MTTLSATLALALVLLSFYTAVARSDLNFGPTRSKLGVRDVPSGKRSAPAISNGNGEGNGGQTWPLLLGQKRNAEYCHSASDNVLGSFAELYQTIAKDLAPWWESGISASLMSKAVATPPISNNGVGIAFVGGHPYLTTDPSQTAAEHHKRLLAAHLALFQALSAAFGTELPDVEFIVSTGDEPSVLLHHYANGTDPQRLPPILRFCKSVSYADILVPSIHFAMRNFTAQLLDRAANFSATWPWGSKREVLFGRFSPYDRLVHRQAPQLMRRGKGGQDICKQRSRDGDKLSCAVRKHAMGPWARGAKFSGVPVDVAQQPKADMLHHSRHNWLLHLDGQSCSSRLEQLLALGSLVVKEESGYYAFFHHLLQPYQHYVPFWREVPEEAGKAIKWAREHDEEAAQIAQEAQRLAVRYLHKRAIVCYWFTLLKELSSLLRYPVGPAAGGRRYHTWVPLQEYMDREGNRVLSEARLTHMEFWD